MTKETKDIKSILLLISLVERNPAITIARLAELMGCGKRLVEEYLDRALMCGVPPYMPDDYVGFIRNGDEITLTHAQHLRSPARLSLREGMSLRLLLESLPHSAESETTKNLSAKIQCAMRPDAGSTPASASIASADKTRFDDTKFIRLRNAIRDCKKVSIEYYSVASGGMTSRKVSPYALVEHSGEWYLAGDCHTRRKELLFRLDRIRSIEIIDETFCVPKNFKPEKYRRKDIYLPASKDIRCEIACAPGLARMAAELPGAKKIRSLGDGRKVLALSASGVPWLFRFLLKFAPDVELLKPANLRTEYMQMLKNLTRIYET